MQVSAIIPAYNEAAVIGATIRALQKIPELAEILVIDDGSEDLTAAQALLAGAAVRRLPQNVGKGGALQEGVRLAQGEILCFVDADLGQSAVEFRHLLRPVLAGEADMTVAVFPPAARPGGFGLVKGLAGYGVNKLAGYQSLAPLSGQRVLRREVWESLQTLPFGFGVEVGLTVECLRQGYRLQEIPVQMTHRETGRDLSGFKHRGRQFLHLLRTLIQLWAGRGVKV
ncbi:MAG: glycosyltransferase family 2 protein [Firmicutes bacterium]|jgi:hypothetical protein|nr:glycosyltransferase family 2 protein [Bacillota bacterium]